MKLDQLDQLHADIEIVSDMEKFRQYTFVGTKKLYPGHSLFSLNLANGEITKEKYDADVMFDYSTKGSRVKGRIITKDTFLYVAALNEKNAYKHFENMLQDVRTTAQFIRDYPLMNIENFAHWDILNELGFETFKDEARKAAAFVEDVRFTKKETNENNKGFEKMSVCHFLPMFKNNELTYYVSMSKRELMLYPEMCDEYSLVQILASAFYNFYDAIKSDKRLSPKYLKSFKDKWEWLYMMEEQDIKNFRKLLKENTHVNKVERP